MIVIEDDIVTTKGFLTYMNEALDMYMNEEQVMHISGYFPQVNRRLPQSFFYNQTSCWGWATWKRAWTHFNQDAAFLKQRIIESNRLMEFNLDGAYTFSDHLEANISQQMKTWAVKWHASVFLRNGLSLHPARSMVQNIGFDTSGENCHSISKYNIADLVESIPVHPVHLKENKKARRAMYRFYKDQHTWSFRKRSIHCIKTRLKRALN